MKENLSGAMLRVGVFLAVCTLGLVAMLAVFAQLRFETEKTYAAEFHTVSGLENGNFVRIAGVEVGKVRTIRIRDDGIALVEFGADAVTLAGLGGRSASPDEIARMVELTLAAPHIGNLPHPLGVDGLTAAINWVETRYGARAGTA